LSACEAADTAFLEDPAQRLAQFGVHFRQQAGQHLGHRNLHAQRLHHAGELAPDHAAADDQQPLGKFLPVQRLVAGADELRIVRPAGYARRCRSGCENRLVGGEPFARPAFGGKLEPARAVAPGQAPQDGDVSCGKEALNAAAEPGNDLIFALLDFRPVEGDPAGDLNAHVSGAPNGVQQLGRRQQRLGRDAPVVKARAAKVGLFDHGDPGAHLGGFESRNVSTRPAPDNGNVKMLFGHQRILYHCIAVTACRPESIRSRPHPLPTAPTYPVFREVP